MKHPTILIAALAVAVIASGCALVDENAPKNDTGALKGVTWEWMETRTPAGLITVHRPTRYTIKLKENGEAQIRYDCNHGGGMYEMSGNELTFGPLIATRVFCGEESQGFSYRQQLQIVKSFYREEGSLFFELQDQGVTMRFRRAGDD